jgi:hypothetical protein
LIRIDESSRDVGAFRSFLAILINKFATEWLTADE